MAGPLHPVLVVKTTRILIAAIPKSFYCNKILMDLKTIFVRHIWQTKILRQTTRFCNAIQILLINRPGAAGLFYENLRYSLSHPFPPNLQNITTPKPLELRSWNFETTFTTPCVLRVTFPVSHDMYHVSKEKKKSYNLVELVGGGSVNNGPTPSSF